MSNNLQSKAQTQQLELVKDQAEQKQRELAENFEKAVNFVQGERKQLLQLQDYETDYLEKIKQEQGAWTAETTGRYRNFCHQLSQAIVEQSGKLTEAEKQLDKMRKTLCEQQQKINVLDDLIEREHLQAAHVQNHLQQKEMDEHSTRLYCR